MFTKQSYCIQPSHQPACRVHFWSMEPQMSRMPLLSTHRLQLHRTFPLHDNAAAAVAAAAAALIAALVADPVPAHGTEASAPGCCCCPLVAHAARASALLLLPSLELLHEMQLQLLTLAYVTAAASAAMHVPVFSSAQLQIQRPQPIH